MTRKASKKTLYLLSRTLDVMGDRENVSGRLNCIVDRYNEIIQRQNIRDRFADGEWATMVKVIGATRWEPAAVIVASIPQVFQSPAAARLMQEDGVVRAPLLEKLSALSIAEKMAVIELVEAQQGEMVHTC